MTTALAERDPIETAGHGARRRVVVRPAPRREPPFDDELDPTAVRTGPHDLRLPLVLVRRPPAVLSTAVLRPKHLPDPAPWARRLLVGTFETAAGRRPQHQLAAFFSPTVLRGLGSFFDRPVNHRKHWLHRATVRSVRASEPREGVAEVSAVVDADGRVRAIALRLEEYRGHWRCVRLQLG